MLGSRVISAVWLFVLVCLFHVACGRPHADDEEEKVRERHKRQSNGISYGWKHTEYLIANLRQRLNNNDLYFCRGDPFKGVQCPEEAKCVDWHEICDGHQTCGLEVREACINSTIDSYGRTDDRFCVGDEDPKWCAWKRLAPHRCGEDFTFDMTKKRRQYRIRHPGHPASYLNDRYCFWTVSTLPNHTLTIQFNKFRTEANYDFLSLGQGLRRDDDNTVLLYKHSGESKPPTFRTNPRMPNPHQVWVSFRSDDWDTNDGFIIEVSDSSRNIRADYMGSNPLKTRPSTDCGGRVVIPVDGEKTLTSPGYPEFYDTHIVCTWIVSARRGRRIEVRFTLFDVEENEDYVSLGNGPTARRSPIFYRKTGVIRDFRSLRHISTASDVWLMFESSLAIARQGFVVKFREVPITECGGTLLVPNNGSIAVASKNYPNLAYSSNMDCTWSIKNEEGRRMWISFHDFSTEWRKDFLSMGNGAPEDRNRTTAIINLHSGNHMPDPYDFTSAGDEVWMTFTTSRYTNHRGFLVDIFDEMLHPPPVTTAPPTTQPPPTTARTTTRRREVAVTRRPKPTRRSKPRPGPVVLPGFEPAPTNDYVPWTWPVQTTTTRRPTTRRTTRRTTTTKRPTTTRRTTTTTRRPTTTRRTTTTTRRPTTTRRTSTTRRTTTTKRPTTTTTTKAPTTIRTTTTSRPIINPWEIPSDSSSSSSVSFFSSLDSTESQFV